MENQGSVLSSHRLLDLTLRNRLLHFRDSKQTVEFQHDTPGTLEDEIASGKTFRIVSEIDMASSSHRFLDVRLPSEELRSRLTTLYRRTKADLAEGGSNTLFLALGFLHWKESDDETRMLRAPLILVPAKLIRKNAGTSFRLCRYEDETRFNATLIQKLKREFDCDLSSLENELPRDSSGIHFKQVLRTVAEQTNLVPGASVSESCVLARFSFAKYLMWKDLVAREDQLQRNRVVRHLLRSQNPANQTSTEPFQSACDQPLPTADSMDTRLNPAELVTPLPADSSQAAAVMAASQGHDFVLVGPPGTGKSQTIANMIAQCLANRKTVLFVAEKTAALNVVHRRLRELGMDDVCLAVHSDNADRRAFIGQLYRSWAERPQPNDSEWDSINDALKNRREELNAYVDQLHHRHANGWTPFEALGKSPRSPKNHCTFPAWKNGDHHDDHRFQSFLDAVDQLSQASIRIDPSRPLPWIGNDHWSAGWENDLLTSCDDLADHAQALSAALQRFSTLIGAKDVRDGPSVQIDEFRQLAKCLMRSTHENFDTVFDDDIDGLVDALCQLDAQITAFDTAANSIEATFDDETIRRMPLSELLNDWHQAVARRWPFSVFARRKVDKRLQTFAATGTTRAISDLDVLRTMQFQLAEIDLNTLQRQTHLWSHRKTEIGTTHRHLKLANEIRALLDSIGKRLENHQSLTDTLRPILRNTDPQEPNHQSLLRVAKEYLDATAAFLNGVKDFESHAKQRLTFNNAETTLAQCCDLASKTRDRKTRLRDWCRWNAAKQNASFLGLDQVANAVELGRVSDQELDDYFRRSYANWWLPSTIDKNNALRGFDRRRHEDCIDSLRTLDDDARAAAVNHIRDAIAHDLPTPHSVSSKTELGILRHQAGLKRPSKSIREMILSLPTHLRSLAPCMMMSPLSIAQYLPADDAPFDVVIFDEASQIPTWDSLGAIGRGMQTVIVGDPKQLPPTSFFSTSGDDEDGSSKDPASILDEAIAAGIPTIELTWHYRSRHESLIEFSNRHYYDNQLTSFPSPHAQDHAIQFCHVPNGLYGRSGSRTNEMEAAAVVEDLTALMTKALNTPEQDRQTFGVVTFNGQQQTLIENMMDQVRRENPELEWFFADDHPEPTIIKNLENVQGDERDVVLFSITFAHSENDDVGDVPLNFGPLTLAGGHRRLNVAVTRARQQLKVFCSFQPNQLNVRNVKHRGLRDLKSFLQFAQNAVDEMATDQLREPKSDLEQSIRDALQRHGWTVDCQIGVSEDKIDLAVHHPDRPGEFLAAIECDGVDYQGWSTAIDRDKTRPLVLKTLGWNIIRAWSPDWWYDAESAAEDMHNKLMNLLNNS